MAAEEHLDLLRERVVVEVLRIDQIVEQSFRAASASCRRLPGILAARRARFERFPRGRA